MCVIRIKTEIKKTVPWKLAVIFLCFSAAIILLGITLYKSERNLILKEQGNSLSAIAYLKIRQIEQWHSERIADAAVIKNDRPLIRGIRQFLNSSNDELRNEISRWMNSVLNGYDYSNVLLIDTLFNVRLTVSQSDIVSDDAIRKELKEILKSHNIIMTDLHRSKDIPWVHMDILVPLIDSVKGKENPVGIAILRVNPEKILFPLIQSWPTQSKSSETLLIRKEGDSVLYLNELRHRQNTALNLRFSLKDGSLPAVKAVNGVLGLVQGMDYRNKPVVAWLADVPEFSWKMVAKVDEEEILLPLKRYAVLIIVAVILLILINASVFGFWIWKQRISSYKKQLQDEKSIRELEGRFRSLYENVSIGIYRTTIDGRILMANPAMVNMLGFDSFEQLAERNLEQEGYEPDYPRSEFLERIEKQGKIVGIESAWKQRNGNTLFVRENASAVRDAQGRILYYDGTVEDITERRNTEEALRENERRLKEAQEMAHLGFWFWDVKTGYVEWSDEVFKIFWLDPKTFTPQIDSILALSPWEEDNDRDNELINRAINSHSPGSYEQKFLRPDKSIGYYYSTFQGNYDEKGGVISIVGTVLDITERKIAESQIKKLNEDLEQRVKLRTEQLEDSNKELEAFSYSVSHDLRAPLRSIHGYTKILIEEYENKLDDEGKRICGIISSSATQMGELIDDLLNFSRIGRSSLTPLLLDMKFIVNSVFADISSSEEKSRIKLNIGKLHKAFGDANLIKLVWNNLISNAIKYSSKENVSEISVSSQLKYDRITYSVKDNGVGFDMNYKHKLFGVFQRLHSESEFEGNGVGLAIVQRIILKHGGKVWAEGEVGKGATFYFSLPVIK